MSNTIENPYVACRSQYTKGWNVTYRYLIAGKICFKFICATNEAETAKRIAKLLNKNLEK